MEKKTEMIQEQEYADTQVHAPEELIQDKKSEKQLVQTLSSQEKEMTEDVVELREDREMDEEKLDELSEKLKGGDESEESEGLDPEVLARKLEWVLCYVYDVYLRAKKDGEHCPFVQVGDYVFAATMGFTCGHVDEVKVFKETEKRYFLYSRRKNLNR